MRSVPLSTESNHLKVTSTPEPLSLTISIFIYLHRECFDARQPITDRSIKESRRLIVLRMNLLVPMLYFCQNYDPSAGGDSHVKFTQARKNSVPNHDMFCHSKMPTMLFRNFMKFFYTFFNRSGNILKTIRNSSL